MQINNFIPIFLLFVLLVLLQASQTPWKVIPILFVKPWMFHDCLWFHFNINESNLCGFFVLHSIRIGLQLYFNFLTPESCLFSHLFSKQIHLFVNHFFLSKFICILSKNKRITRSQLWNWRINPINISGHQILDIQHKRLNNYSHHFPHISDLPLQGLHTE